MSLVARRKIDFSQRLKHGLKFEDQTERVFKQHGLQICKFGVGMLPDYIKNKLVFLNDSTSKFLRFLPDRLCISEFMSFFLECKAKMTNTAYYSYSLDSYEAGLKLADLGIRILVVFSGLEAQWIEKIPVARVVTEKKTLHLVNGSGKPFILIPKTGLDRLESVLKGLKT